MIPGPRARIELKIEGERPNPYRSRPLGLKVEHFPQNDPPGIRQEGPNLARQWLILRQPDLSRAQGFEFSARITRSGENPEGLLVPSPLDLKGEALSNEQRRSRPNLHHLPTIQHELQRAGSSAHGRPTHRGE